MSTDDRTYDKITPGGVSYEPYDSTMVVVPVPKPQASVGSKLPAVTFKLRTRTAELTAAGSENPFDWMDKTTDDLFAGKRIAFFALPGAFTPTCSEEQLPGFNEHFDAIVAAGVDDVYCLAVNDAFVMRQWGLHQGLTEAESPILGTNFAKVKLIPDGAALFTRGMGLNNVWTSERGFGERSWRYSAVINNGTVEWISVEDGRVDNSGPDPFEVASAERLLKYLTSKST